MSDSLQASEQFKQLDDAAKQLVIGLANSERSLTKLVHHSAQITREHISQEVGRLERLYIEDRFYQDIKASLFFPEISARQEQIHYEFDGFEDSNNWIFQELSHFDSHQEDSFK